MLAVELRRMFGMVPVVIRKECILMAEAVGDGRERFLRQTLLALGLHRLYDDCWQLLVRAWQPGIT